MRRSHASNERWWPRLIVRGDVGKHISAAVKCDIDPGQVGGVHKDRPAQAMSLLDDGTGTIQGHQQDAITFDRASEYLDAVRAGTNFATHALNRGGRGQVIGEDDSVLIKIFRDVTRHSVHREKRFAGGENARAKDLAACDTGPNDIGVGEYRGNIKDGREAPASQHLL